MGKISRYVQKCQRKKNVLSKEFIRKKKYIYFNFRLRNNYFVY